MAWAIACFIISIVFGGMSLLPTFGQQRDTLFKIAGICMFLFMITTLDQLLGKKPPEDQSPEP